MKRKWIRYLGIGVLWFAVVLFLFGLETFRRARREFKEAEKLYQKKEIDMAILYYGTVISFYTPFSPYVKKSIERLFEIAEKAEKRKDYRQAGDAYDEIIHRIYSIRSFYTPHISAQKKAKKRKEELLPLGR